ncbi:unnamed protein product [Zymoseptoria tritici ST99CH_1A5]|uniref:Uncharacterized protein n=1 Tax=Zymoseptoria tritici ST99CH_1A5 TaxID=1276529 RepID=A0A1Y6L5J3_ZYMTR|nr:unnamed protein product [Zymoseptoria tritici ST99CH_1A5]
MDQQQSASSSRRMRGPRPPAPQSPSDSPEGSPPPTTKASQQTKPKPTRRKRGNNQHGDSKSAREKVDFILQTIRGQHLSFEDFLTLYVTTKKEWNTPDQGERAATRAAKLARILQEDKVVECIAPHMSDSKWLSAASLAKELEDLKGRKDRKLPAEELDYRDAVAAMGQYVPSIQALVKELLGLPATQDLSKPMLRRISLISSMLLRIRHPRSGNQFAMQLGVYLQSQGVKRRVLAVLARLGICGYPKSIYRCNRMLYDLAAGRIKAFGRSNLTHGVFDNLDYFARVGQHGFGRRDVLKHVTTAKWFKSIEVPRSGLKKELFREDRPLQLQDILDGPGNRHDA